MIDDLSNIRDEIRGIESTLKDLKDQYNNLEAEIINRLDTENTPRSSGSLASVSLNETQYASIEDYEAFTDYIRNNDAMYLFERRVAQGPFRELLQVGESIPGVSVYQRRRLNLRKS